MKQSLKIGKRGATMSRMTTADRRITPLRAAEQVLLGGGGSSALQVAVALRQAQGERDWFFVTNYEKLIRPTSCGLIE
jgi:hypothetical protein